MGRTINLRQTGNIVNCVNYEDIVNCKYLLMESLCVFNALSVQIASTPKHFISFTAQQTT